MDEIEVAIVGGGPAGLAAALYATRAGRRSVLFEGSMLGGQIAMTGLVESYPGFPEGVEGPELALAMHEQAERFGLKTRYARVQHLAKDEDGFALETSEGPVRARAVIVTSGGERRRLGVPGEDTLEGSGVSYCATCDAHFFAGQPVAVVGGGDAALDEALFAARHASRVYVVHRRGELRAAHILQERARAEPKIELVSHSRAIRVLGSGEVEGLELRDARSEERRSLAVAAVFVFVGQTPNTGIFEGLVDLDGGGHAPVDAWMQTSVPGLFCAGEARAQSARQIVSVAGDGATAAIAADRYLSPTATR